MIENLEFNFELWSSRVWTVSFASSASISRADLSRLIVWSCNLVQLLWTEVAIFIHFLPKKIFRDYKFWAIFEGSAAILDQKFQLLKSRRVVQIFFKRRNGSKFHRTSQILVSWLGKNGRCEKFMDQWSGKLWIVPTLN